MPAASFHFCSLRFRCFLSPNAVQANFCRVARAAPSLVPPDLPFEKWSTGGWGQEERWGYVSLAHSSIEKA